MLNLSDINETAKDKDLALFDANKSLQLLVIV